MTIDHPQQAERASCESTSLRGHRFSVHAEEVWLVADLLCVGVITGDDANKSALAACRGPDVLHIATHAYGLSSLNAIGSWTWGSARIPRDALLDSGLILAGADDVASGKEIGTKYGKGILTGREVAELRLDGTRLAVRSACDTGIGQVRRGQGVLGLSAAFLAAGADAVILTLWKVEDQSTTEFMKCFYSALTSTGDETQAFRRAQSSMAQKFTDPRAWAAFQHYGRASSARIQ
ncbi:CHAT domain-containing protein [Agrococcus sp. DT81.2]|uniref:CHAT domain-containing protein n=1 Tax=Agrococcus sp. DT81.2 TaxID=3393414 RepID=UPI003CE45D7C